MKVSYKVRLEKMAKRIPEASIQEDPVLLMYFDNASLMLGDLPW